MCKKIKLINKILISSLFLFFISFGLVGGCGVSSTAPDGSTIELISELEGVISLCALGSYEPIPVKVVVRNIEGEPLNDVEVEFFLSFSGIGTPVIDSDGDGIPDEPVIMLIDNDQCPSTCWADEKILFDREICKGCRTEAYLPSGVKRRTNDSGVAEITLLIRSGGIIDPASLEIYSGSATPSIQSFSVNTDCETEGG